MIAQSRCPSHQIKGTCTFGTSEKKSTQEPEEIPFRIQLCFIELTALKLPDKPQIDLFVNQASYGCNRHHSSLLTHLRGQAGAVGGRGPDRTTQSDLWLRGIVIPY